MTEERTGDRLGELREEARGLEDELRRLRAISALEPLDLGEEQRKEKIEARLREIRGEAEGVAATRREAHAERKRWAREAAERKVREAGERRSRDERERDLRSDIIRARHERIGPRVGISVGGQPPGHPVIVKHANRVEEGLALQFDAQALDLVGVRAFCVREPADDAAWGIRVKPGGSGEIEAGSVGGPSPVTALQGVPPWAV